jgi:CBS domain-containing protein
MLLRGFAILALALSVTACAESAGQPSGGFIDPSLTAAYLPLYGKTHVIMDARGAATVVAPEIAATNAHNANIVPDSDVIGVSRDYDLLFFRTGRGPAPPVARPWIGEMVIAYGQGAHGELREARGIVRSLSAPVVARCPDCPVQEVLTFEANAGEGFSGGPVVDATNGRLVGIVFGFNDMKDGSRLMYAYDMARVMAEFSEAGKTPAQTAAQGH